ncbi:hypothetical protein [Rhodomicrobium lacus]|uniref:hypothetical protein n=1 Tax=Rhodomicrobium lacus TaxID=2498452 RepID=UPI000F8F19AA|nr:hypothetical protein [Rhodomicrobium lacus]
MTTKPYTVRPGIVRINGARVPETRIVHLDDAAARFDLDHGNIVPQVEQTTTEPKKAVKAAASDGGA